jgi:hypothetical protein
MVPSYGTLFSVNCPTQSVIDFIYAIILIARLMATNSTNSKTIPGNSSILLGKTLLVINPVVIFLDKLRLDLGYLQDEWI